jgi:thioredoxin 1
MPTFQVFKDGKKVGELVGASPQKLEQLLEAHA